MKLKLEDTIKPLQGVTGRISQIVIEYLNTRWIPSQGGARARARLCLNCEK